jgi:hypothetical protein
LYAKPNMLTKLTEEQERQIPKQIDYWVNLVLHSGRRVEIDDVEDYIKRLYYGLGFEKPEIQIYDSYMAAKIATAKVFPVNKGRAYYDMVWAEFGEVVFQTKSVIDSQVEIRLGSELWRRIFEPVMRQVNGIVSQNERQVKSLTQFVEQSEGLNSKSGHVAFYDYFEQIGLLNYVPFSEWRDYLKSGIWSVDYFNRHVIISRLPTKVICDQNGRPHSLTEPAVQWADGLNSHAIRGVWFPEDVWNAVAKKTISANDAISLPNLEQRIVACQIIGYDTVLAELGAKLIDEEINYTSGGKEMHYSLFEINLKDDAVDRPAKFVKVECPTTGRETLLRVPPTIHTVRTAVAWTFGMRPDDYTPEIET